MQIIGGNHYSAHRPFRKRGCRRVFHRKFRIPVKYRFQLHYHQLRSFSRRVIPDSKASARGLTEVGFDREQVRLDIIETNTAAG